MPSDTVLQAALAAVAPRIRDFRAYLADALGHVERQIADARDGDADRDARVAAELGEYAAGRVDAARFAAVASGARTLDVDEISTLHELHATLAELERAPDARFVVDVPTGGDPGHFVGDALADFGRAFGAATAAELMRTGRFAPDTHAFLLEPLPPARWTAAQRRVSPALVVTVDGADLRVGALAQYLDDSQRVVILVRGACPPAPLARLMTPGVLVVQTNSTDALALLATCAGPAVIAIVPEGAATFVHQPGTGPAQQRLHVTFAPTPPRRALGDWTAFQQQQDLLLLQAANAAPTTPTASAPAPVDAVDRLTAWLLTQAGGPS